MENKELYYTPNLKELKIGYICETNTRTSDSPNWIKHIFKIDDFEEIDSYLHFYRVKYLTKEDIKSCKWKTTKHKYVFKKNNYKLTGLGFFGENKIRISFLDKKLAKMLTIYYGKCSSINEFKYITEELLNIK